jgi:hypothetical protein
VKRLSYGLAALVLAGCGLHDSALRGNRAELVLSAPGARSVVLVVTGDRFEQIAARPDDHGSWIVSVPATEEFAYFYLLDGEPHVPDCRFKEHDELGTMNCIFMPRAFEVGHEK